MDTEVLIAIIVVAAIVLAAVAFFVYTSRQRSELRSRFGPEYDRTVRGNGSRKEAEQELKRRQERVEKLQIQPLDENQKQRFSDEWTRIQSRFVDEPDDAVVEADKLLAEVMSARGYPASSYDEISQDVSVEHPEAVGNYRAAHQIVERSQGDGVSTEELRKAFQNYRVLFRELVEAA